MVRRDYAENRIRVAQVLRGESLKGISPNLAKEDVPDSVCRAYGVERLKFGPEYLIPKPFGPRVLLWEASAVAEAAMRTGVFR